MVDLGINVKPEARWPGSTDGKTTASPDEVQPDWLIQMMFSLSYCCCAFAYVVGWFGAFAVARETDGPQPIGVMLLVTVAAIPAITLAETVRVGIRMLCIIARKN